MMSRNHRSALRVSSECFNISLCPGPQASAEHPGDWEGKGGGVPGSHGSCIPRPHLLGLQDSQLACMQQSQRAQKTRIIQTPRPRGALCAIPWTQGSTHTTDGAHTPARRPLDLLFQEHCWEMMNLRENHQG